MVESSRRRKDVRMKCLRLGISKCRQSGETDMGHYLALSGSGVSDATFASADGLVYMGGTAGAFGGINTTEPLLRLGETWEDNVRRRATNLGWDSAQYLGCF